MAGDGDSDSESGRSYERNKKSDRFCKKGSEGALKGKFRKKIPAVHAGGVGTRVGEKRPATRAGGVDPRSARWIRGRRIAARVSCSGDIDKQEAVSDIDSGGDSGGHSGGDEVKSVVGRHLRRAPAGDNGGERTSRWMRSDTSSGSGSDTSSEEGTGSCSEEEKGKKQKKQPKVLIDLISSSENEKGKKQRTELSKQKQPELSKQKKQPELSKQKQPELSKQKKQQKGKKKASFNEHVQKIWTLNKDIRTTKVEILGLVDQLSKANAKKMELQRALENEQRKPIKNFRVEV